MRHERGTGGQRRRTGGQRRRRTGGRRRWRETRAGHRWAEEEDGQAEEEVTRDTSGSTQGTGRAEQHHHNTCHRHLQLSSDLSITHKHHPTS